MGRQCGKCPQEMDYISQNTMITIRPARKEDAEFIARGFLMAMWMTEEEIAELLPTCCDIARMDDTLYSWRNTCIAQWDGEDAGVLISYDGATYHDASRKTFTIVKERGGEDFLNMTEEAEAGEWYIDTLAVRPEFRRKGIATALLKKGIELSRQCPTTHCATLYVDGDHPWVVDLYKSVGFEHAGEAFIFGQIFQKMKH